MSSLSAQDLRAQLESIDACLRKYVRLRAQIIEVLAFMEDEKEQDHLRAIRERSRTAGPAADAEVVPEPLRSLSNGLRPKAPSASPDELPPRRPNPLSTTLSMEA